MKRYEMTRIKITAAARRSRLIRAAAMTVMMLVTAVGAQQERQGGTSPSLRPGQTATQLPDGRWLLIGGEGTESQAGVWDPATDRTAALAAPHQPRAWHTATLLPDGSVLVYGGQTADGTVLAAPERLPAGGRTFEPFLSDGLTPRAHHAATVLTDGSVLVTGGRRIDALDDALLWDPVSGAATVIGLLPESRQDHQATLAADGTVRLSGGRGADNRIVQPDAVYDPAAQLFSTGTARVDNGPFTLAGSLPFDGQADVSVHATVAVRLSRPADVRSITADAVVLSGPDGPVAVRITPAEGGRLIFVTPVQPLSAGTAYVATLNLSDAVRRSRISDTAIRFTTAPDATQTSTPDEDDDWHPDISGTDTTWKTGRPSSSWERLPRLKADAGVTAVSGQVLKLNSTPLAGVTLKIGDRSTKSDRTGRFLLTDVPSGRHVMEIEGESANTPGRTYGFFEVGVPITTGQTNVLPYVIWMPRLDLQHQVRIPSPTTSEVVVTTPFIPGLELRIPPGTVIKDEEGEVVTELGITAIPVDRPPFPLATNVDVPVYFTIQPGSAYLYDTQGRKQRARLVYPNYHGANPGVLAAFWNYDPEEIGWHVYGTGVVTGNGRQVTPGPGVGIYEFTGAMMQSGSSPAATGPTPHRPARGGDPVDLATGLITVENTDISLPDVIPLALTRTYRQNDPAARPFGIGATHPYAMFLWSAQQYQEADLILPDSARVHYVRTSSGSGFQDAVFEHTSTPGEYYKSTISWNTNGWDLKLRNGTVLVFGENAPLQAIRDRWGNTVTITHANGQTGNITRVRSPNGRWLEFTYDGSNRITQVKDNGGRIVGYTYDASGRLWKVTDPALGVTEYTYDASHRLLTIKDARGLIFLSNHYDASGRVDTQTQADSTTFQFAYTVNGSGVVTQTDVTNPRGYVRRWSFNAAMQPTVLVEAFGTSLARTTTWTRDATTNRVTRFTDGLGRNTDYTYDAKGNVASVTRLAGTSDAMTTSHSYDANFSQLTSITDPLGHVTSFTRDAWGNATVITDPLSHQITATYNTSGQPLTMTTAAGATQFVYEAGDLVATTDPLGRTATQFVDGLGRVQRTTLPSGAATRYEYDSLNRVIKAINPGGAETHFTYDANSNLLTLVDPLSHTNSYSYNAMDRVDSRQDALLRSETYSYDQGGNLQQTTDRKTQITSRSYDALDRLSSVSYQGGAVTSYSYDLGDRLTQVSDSVSGTITRTYDGLDRLTSEVSPEGTVSYTYDGADRRLTMVVAGQVSVSYSYDDANRLTGIAQGTASAAFAYDAANRRTQLTLPSGVTVTYGYDTASQLTSLTYAQGATVLGTLTYAYDADGRRSSVGGTWSRTLLPATLASATYDAANQLATWAGTAISYDANGNIMSDGATSYTWNSRNQLVGLTGGASGTFQYDAFGRRRARTTAAGATQFLYDGLDAVQELTSGTPSANLLVSPELDEALRRSDAAGSRDVLSDALGSTVALTDATGAVVTAYSYAPFGGTSVTGASTDSLSQFSGRENESSGLYFYRARFYDTLRQRFVSEDPLGFWGGDANLYAYVGNSPTVYSDPLGLQYNTPAQGQPPNSTQWHMNRDGSVTRRFFGPDGRAVQDMDFGQRHGYDPEVHDWDWTQKNPRQPGRPAPRALPPGPSPEAPPTPPRGIFPDLPSLPLRLPGPLPLILNPCLINPSLCQPPPGRKMRI